MKKDKDTSKFEPVDSDESTPADNQVVKKKQDTQYKEQSATLQNPEEKRKYSEQPPTKHNTHN